MKTNEENLQPLTKQKMQSLSAGKISATALAVGTGLGLGMPADAAIVYNDIVDVTLEPFMLPNETQTHDLDLDSNGVIDFTFSQYLRPQGYCGYGCYITLLGISDVSGAGPNGVMNDFNGLAPGTSIDGSQTFAPNSNLGFNDYYVDFGNWDSSTTGLLGLQFDIDGQTHYGWAQLGVGFDARTLTLFDFAYEDVAGQGILAGQTAVPIPAMAPLFGAAIGAMGALGFRRKKREARKSAEMTA